MSGFSTLNTAISGLTAAQRGMDVVGQNITNANTPGYSRQVVRLASIGATTAATFHTGNNFSTIGGVAVESVSRIRDTFLEGTRVAAGATKSALEAQTTALKGVEQLLSEPGDGGLQAVLDDFYSSWQTLAQNPGNGPAGAIILQRGTTVAAQLKFVSDGIGQRWETSYEELKATVSQLNQAASDLAGVNAKIREGTVAGRPVNELMDQRDTLARTLGDLAGGTARAMDDGMISVSVNGMVLVSGAHAERFTLSGGADLPSATADPPTVSFGSTAVPVASGKAAGLLAALRTDLPATSATLDDLAISLRDVVNTVHSAGYTASGAAGGDFFVGGSASSLRVLPTTFGDLAVASAPGVVNGENARALGDLAIDTNAQAVLGGDSPSQRWRELTGAVGTQLQGLTRALQVQESVVATADSAVESDSGVNLDEEMTSLLMFQRSYQASARVITAMDEVLDTLVNRLGTIGR